MSKEVLTQSSCSKYTATEILDDDVRQQFYADKINTEQWLEIVNTPIQKLRLLNNA